LISGISGRLNDRFNGNYEYNGKTNCKASYAKNENGRSTFIKWFEEPDYRGYVIGYNSSAVDYYTIYTDGNTGYSACPSDRSLKTKWRYIGKSVRSIKNKNSRSFRLSRIKLDVAK